LILVIIFSVPISYILARYRFKLRNTIYVFFVLGLLIPIHSTLLPLFLTFRTLGMLDKWYTLILPYTGFGLPLAIFLLESFIRTGVPIEMDEAAKIDGASTFRIITNIIFPVCKSPIIAVCILTFLTICTDFAFPVVLISNDRLKTLQLGLTKYIGPYSANYPELMAALVIVTIPILIIYILFQRGLIKGMTIGAVKE
jgi:raffinose/stachyose/melibiose transport system permease protein